MLADLDQFRRDNSHGAIIGRKGFVNLRHFAADSGTFLDKVDIIAGIGHIKGGLHSGNASADYQYRSCRVVRHEYLLKSQPHLRQIRPEIGPLVLSQASQ